MMINIMINGFYMFLYEIFMNTIKISVPSFLRLRIKKCEGLWLPGETIPSNGAHHVASTILIQCTYTNHYKLTLDLWTNPNDPNIYPIYPNDPNFNNPNIVLKVDIGHSWGSKDNDLQESGVFFHIDGSLQEGSITLWLFNIATENAP